MLFRRDAKYSTRIKTWSTYHSQMAHPAVTNRPNLISNGAMTWSASMKMNNQANYRITLHSWTKKVLSTSEMTLWISRFPTSKKNVVKARRLLKIRRSKTMRHVTLKKIFLRSDKAPSSCFSLPPTTTRVVTVFRTLSWKFSILGSTTPKCKSFKTRSTWI